MIAISPVSPFSGNPLSNESKVAVCGESVYLSYLIESQRASSLKIEVLAPETEGFQVPDESVHYWLIVPNSVSGGGLYQGAPLLREEFLVKEFPFLPDDSYKDGRKEALKSILKNPRTLFSKKACKLLLKSFPVYVPPRVRFDGHLSIAEGVASSIRILIRIDVPREAPSGSYLGCLLISDSSGVREESEYKLELAKGMLDDSSRDTLMFYRGTLDPLSPHAPQHFVDEKRFRIDLASIRDAGFRSISLQESRVEHLTRALAICKELGFCEHILFRRPFPSPELLTHYDFFTPVLYASDEISTLPELWPLHHEAVSLAKEIGALSFATILSPNTLDRFSEENCMPDLISVYAASESSRSLLCENNNKEGRYYYWLTHLEKPLVHSFLSGCYFYKSAAQGLTPYSYQHMPVSGSSPYHEYDDWEPSLDKPQQGQISRHVLTVYPAADGIVSTLQWEALRAGLIEQRLIESVLQLEKACVDKKVSISEEAKDLLERVYEYLENIDLMNIDILSPHHTLPYKGFHSEEYEAWQDSLLQCFFNLSKLLQRDCEYGC